MIALNVAARLKAEAADVDRVYAVGKVPAGGDRTYPYATVAVTRDRTSAPTKAGHGLKVMRLTTQSHGQSLESVLDIDQGLQGAFLEQRLNAVGWVCDPIELQVGGAIVNDPDAGQVLSVTSTYLFTAKEAKA